VTEEFRERLDSMRGVRPLITGTDVAPPSVIRK